MMQQRFVLVLYSRETDMQWGKNRMQFDFVPWGIDWHFPDAVNFSRDQWTNYYTESYRVTWGWHHQSNAIVSQQTEHDRDRCTREKTEEREKKQKWNYIQ